MSNKVGVKGQLVIEKPLRDKLGVKPGWQAVQLLVDDHIEIHFIPPEHNTSLAGQLKAYAKGKSLSSEHLRKERNKAWIKSTEKR
jgi:bifunctional DNA-binding transcriptional regulator/antitoxin component of YhaV-PrlF toxin-antitoxin module